MDHTVYFILCMFIIDYLDGTSMINLLPFAFEQILGVAAAWYNTRCVKKRNILKTQAAYDEAFIKVACAHHLYFVQLPLPLTEKQHLEFPVTKI